jgi:hypothetical protein
MTNQCQLLLGRSSSQLVFSLVFAIHFFIEGRLQFAQGAELHSWKQHVSNNM